MCNCRVSTMDCGDHAAVWMSRFLCKKCRLIQHHSRDGRTCKLGGLYLYSQCLHVESFLSSGYYIVKSSLLQINRHPWDLVWQCLLIRSVAVNLITLRGLGCGTPKREGLRQPYLSQSTLSAFKTSNKHKVTASKYNLF